MQKIFAGITSAQSTSIFAILSPAQERQGIAYQTSRFDPVTREEHRVRWVTAQLLTHAVDFSDWHFHRNEGSYTLQNQRDLSQVISIFVDHDNKLAFKYNLEIRAEPHIVVGMDLSDLSPYLRYMIRADLRHRYNDHYIDPETQKGCKYYLVPKSNHFFDIHFVLDVGCEPNYEILEALEKSTIDEPNLQDAEAEN